MLIELLLVATVLWSMNAFSFHTVSIALPVLTVLLGITTPDKAFSGFSSPTWFLVLGVFALSGAISKTGLLYRFALLMMKPRGAGNELALNGKVFFNKTD